MENKTFVINYEASDETIHEFAVAHLLGESNSELTLVQGNYAYKVSGEYSLVKAAGRPITWSVGTTP